MHLVLIRHGEALSDSENPRRPLSPGGMADAERMASIVARADPRPIELLHSTKLRTRQTAAYFARAWGGVPEREIHGLEPLDDVQPLAKSLASLTSDLAVVGHLPFLPRLASLLLTGDSELELIDLPPAGALCLFRTDGTQPGWSLRWLIAPRLFTP